MIFCGGKMIINGSVHLCSSPYLVQHKKLAEGSAYEEVSTSTPYSENDISNSIKNGILYLEDPINHVSMFSRCKWFLDPARERIFGQK